MVLQGELSSRGCHGLHTILPRRVRVRVRVQVRVRVRVQVRVQVRVRVRVSVSIGTFSSDQNLKLEISFGSAKANLFDRGIEDWPEGRLRLRVRVGVRVNLFDRGIEDWPEGRVRAVSYTHLTLPTKA